MTLVPYAPDDLDALALRLLDLAGTVREMSVSCRESGLNACQIHDKKTLEQLDRIEQWAHKSAAAVNGQIRGHRGRQRAIEAGEKRAHRQARGASSTRPRKRKK